MRVNLETVYTIEFNNIKALCKFTGFTVGAVSCKL